MSEPTSEQSIFLQAIALVSLAERAAYLDEACRNKPKLRAELNALLAAHDRLGGELPPTGADVSGLAPVPLEEPLASPSEAPGTVIGPYKLIQQIGEGGMGTVWMAQQTEPVKRLVALKLIKAGMDSKQVIARFEAERQALALMEHANIARVLDGGTTSAGRPYFVMDLVKGMPITRYCDEHHLTPRQRLELFIPVCQAVQHAHQKGIIHRDLKPSNVLVALYDGKPVPKVIDFGVAKAAGLSLTDKTLVTGFGAIVGTLEYMSPEQAEVNQLDIDTRSDIYSLGVLLYELLAGSPPFSKKDLEKAGMLEMLRVIREDEPSKPSTKLSTAEGLPTLAANRGTEPAKLTRLVRGELDWIVMKALEKDRNRRYETANGFAMDVQRYLADEPVQACPPSAGYRFRKFARRNKGGLAVAALVLFFLVLLGIGIGWAVRDRSAREAEAARQQAERRAKVAGQVEQIFAEVDRLEGEQKWPEALAAARRAEAAVAGGEADDETAERVRARLKDLQLIDRLEGIRMEREEMTDAKVSLDEASPPVAARPRKDKDREYARAFRDYGVDVEELAVETSIQRLKARPVLVMTLAAVLDDWVLRRRGVSKADDAGWKRLVAVARGIDPEPLRDQLRSTWGRPLAETREQLRQLAELIDVWAQHPATLVSLARALREAGHRDAALRILREAQFVYSADFWLTFELAYALGEKRDHEGAVRFYTAAMSLRPHDWMLYYHFSSSLRQLGKLDEIAAINRKEAELQPNKSGLHSLLGGRLRKQGKLDDAVAHFRKAIELDPKNAYAFNALGNALRDQGKLDEANAAFAKALELARKAIEADPKNDSAFHQLAALLRAQGKLAEANAAFDMPIDTLRKAIEADPKNAGLYAQLIGLLRAQGKIDEAIELWRKAIEIDPKQSSVAFDFGKSLSDQGKLDKAIEVYRTAIEADPTNAGRYLLMLADTLSKQKKFPEAIDAYRKAIELHPINPIAYHHLGDALRAQGKLDEAIDAYFKAIELDPKAASTYVNLGNAFSDQKNLPASILAYRRASELGPQNVAFAAYYNLGTVLNKSGRADEAIAAYHKAVELHPKSAARKDLAPCLNNLAWALATHPEPARRDPGRALSLAKEVVELRPQGYSLWNTLGVAHYRAGNWKEAIAAQEKSMELRRGGDSWNYFFLAMAHWQLGAKDKAREWHERAVQWMDKNQPKNNELRRFRTEAEELLKSEKK